MIYASFDKNVRSGSLFWRVYIGHSIHEEDLKCSFPLPIRDMRREEKWMARGGGGEVLDGFLTAGGSKSTHKNQSKLSC